MTDPLSPRLLDQKVAILGAIDWHEGDAYFSLARTYEINDVLHHILDGDTDVGIKSHGSDAIFPSVVHLTDIFYQIKINS